MKGRWTASDISNRLDKLLIVHMWAMTPFVIPWMLFPKVFGSSNDPGTIAAMQIVYLLFFVTLIARTFLVWQRNDWLPWRFIWPIVDVIFITHGCYFGNIPSDSWVIVLYLFPVLAAATAMNIRWSLLVAGLSAVSFVITTGTDELQYTYGVFRLFYLVLVASLATRAVQEIAKNQSKLAIAEYRNDLSAEIHDGLQQYLGAISMQLELARNVGEKEPQKAVQLTVKMQEVARRASDELRLMTRRLRTAELGPEGLEKAIREQIALFGERSNSEVHFEVEGAARPVPTRVEHVILRILSESLTNVAKHAEAADVWIRLTFQPASVRLSVVDNGKGFDPDHLEEGIGLQSMRNRALAAGGSVSIEGNPGLGVSLSFDFPTNGAAKSL